MAVAPSPPQLPYVYDAKKGLSPTFEATKKVHFTETGSGQTQGSLKRERLFFAGAFADLFGLPRLCPAA
jgi:hypothetical protein